MTAGPSARLWARLSPRLSDRPSARDRLCAFACIALLALGALFAIAIVHDYCSPISDTQATLLTSQQIAQHATVRLDAYGESTLTSSGYAVMRKNGHAYDYFPVGTALLSAPLVGVANLLGYDVREHAAGMQTLIVAIIAVATLLVLFAFAGLFVGRCEAVALALLCVFGTSITSTGFITLFSHDFAVLLALVALYLVFRGVRRDMPIPTVALAACLFLAYLCRPTMSVLAVCVLTYLLLRQRVTALRTGVWLAMFLGAFMLWSHHEYAQWLPDYYMPQRLESTELHTALLQNLFGPARGLFVYSPFLVLAPVLALVLAARDAEGARLLVIALVWPLLHWLAISRFPHWWGGWSYGPRLMMDCLPGLFLALFYVLGRLERGRYALRALVAILGVFSIWVNAYVEFASPYPVHWNSNPNVDEYPEYLSDWRYPQFLHNAERQQRRIAEFERVLELPADAPDAQFEGFTPLIGELRWAKGNIASVHVPLRDVGTFDGRVLISADLPARCRLLIRLNGQLIDDAPRVGSRLRIDLHFDPALLREGDNVLQFERQAIAPGPTGFGLHSVSIYPKR